MFDTSSVLIQIDSVLIQIDSVLIQIDSREKCFLLDRVIKELTLRLQQLRALAEKYAFLTPLNLLDGKYKCQIDHDHDDFDKEGFPVERKLSILLLLLILKKE